MNFLLEAFRRNPYPTYAAMRTFAPIFHDRRHGFWLIFDYENVKRALADADVFSSRAAPPGNAALDWLIFLDPPLHSKLRGLVMSAFTPRAIASLETRIVERVDALIDSTIDRGRMDFVTEFADLLPVQVIADMIGLPPHDEPRLRRWTDAILHLGDAIFGGDLAARAVAGYRAAKEEMRPYLHDLVVSRRLKPEDDLLSRLVHADVDRERLSEDDIFSFFQLLLLAGSETTTNLIANALLCLVEHPEQLARVKNDRELLAPAIDEVLRFRAPAQIVFRATTCDVTLARKTIPAGQLVLLVIGAANRDPRQFKQPRKFDIARSPNKHLAFGHGAHYCIGATLSRLETRVALSRVFDRFKGFRLSGPKRWPPRTGLNVHGPMSLPIAFDPA